MTTLAAERTLSAAEAADYLDVHVTTIYQKCAAGILPSEYTPRGRRIPLAVLEAYRVWRAQGHRGQPPQGGELTLAEVAVELGVGVATVHYHIREGHLPVVRRGWRWYVPRGALMS